MIKKEDLADNSTQMWTFNDTINNFYILKKNNLFKFKICQNFINRWHESDEIELQRINQQTIIAAFEPKVEAVTYELTQKSQKSINLQFKVRIDYLSTNCFEDIELKEILMDQKQEKKMQMDELLNETHKLQSRVDEEIKKKNLTFEKDEFNTRSGKIFCFKLEPGNYVFSATGVYILEKLWNGEYYDSDYDSDCADVKLYNLRLKLKIKKGENRYEHYFSTKSYFGDCYEYPYVISGVLDAQNQDEFSFSFEGNQSHDSIVMMKNVLTIIRVSPFK